MMSALTILRSLAAIDSLLCYDAGYYFLKDRCRIPVTHVFGAPAEGEMPAQWGAALVEVYRAFDGCELFVPPAENWSPLLRLFSLAELPAAKALLLAELAETAEIIGGYAEPIRLAADVQACCVIGQLGGGDYILLRDTGRVCVLELEAIADSRLVLDELEEEWPDFDALIGSLAANLIAYLGSSWRHQNPSGRQFVAEAV